MDVAAIILEYTGGEDAELAGLTPEQWLITTFRLAGVQRVAIAGDAGMKRIERTCARHGAEFFRPDKSGAGASGGLCAALRFLKGKCGRILIAPANFTLFEIDTIRRMAGADAPVAAPAYGGARGWPVSISAELIDDLLELGGDLEAFITGADTAVSGLDDAGVITDVAVSDTGALAGGHSLHRRPRPVLKLALAYEQTFFGPGTLQMLRLIDETGSVTQALQLMGMAKSRGWAMLNSFERHTGIRIFDFVGYGSPNNRSTVSSECRTFLDRYEAFSDDCLHHAAESFKRHFGDMAGDDA